MERRAKPTSHRATRQRRIRPATNSSDPRLSLCMIVRDSSRTLATALESIRPWVDELVVVDTGSVDDTREIARSFGARLFEFAWCDDFSAARNESIRHARGQWLFWMDSDDTIDAANGRRLRELAYGKHGRDVLAYVVKVVCPGDSASGVDESTVVDHVKLFRNRPDVRFEFRIHEQLLPSINAVGGKVLWSDIEVVHSGAERTPEARRNKAERDLRILEKEIQERPDHSFALFNFGMTYSDIGQHEEAARYLERCVAVANPRDSQMRKAFALLSHSYQQLGRLDDAWQACRLGRQHYPHDVELLFREANLASARGDKEAAESLYRQLLTASERNHYSSIDRGIVRYKSRYNLAALYEQVGQDDRAENQWRKILEVEPGYVPAWRRLGELLIRRRRFATLGMELAEMEKQRHLAPAATYLKARSAAAHGDPAVALTILREAVEKFPEDLHLLGELGRLEFAHEKPAVTAQTMLRILRIDPRDAATHHNLGTLYLEVGDTAAAIEPLEESLRLRPTAPHTWDTYVSALEKLGRVEQAAAARTLAAQGRPPKKTTNADRSLIVKPAAVHERPSSAPKTNKRLAVGLVTVGYNLPGATRTLIESALQGSRHDVQFIVFSHSENADKCCELESLAERPDVVFHDYRQNRGLAKSWNDGIVEAYERGHDVVIVANEDLVFGKGDLALLAESANKQQDRFLVMGRCWHESEKTRRWSEYGCFALNRLGYERLGCFDENFFPVYYEDNDYRRRAELAGLAVGYCDGTQLVHGGSRSLEEDRVARQNTITYAANRAYYIRKWGGDGGEESFDRPFNDGRFTCYIDPRVRNHPYPGFDRTDHEIVKF